MVEREIDPQVPVRDQSDLGADGKFVRADLQYDRERDLYICPGGKEPMQTEAYDASAGEGKKIETLFGEVEHVLGLTRLRLRGLTGARGEFVLAATGQNLKRLIRHAGPAPPYRWPPEPWAKTSSAGT